MSHGARSRACTRMPKKKKGVKSQLHGHVSRAVSVLGMAHAASAPVAADSAQPQPQPQPRARKPAGSSTASTAGSSTASTASTLATLTWPKRTWRQDRFKSQKHWRRVEAILQSGFSAKMTFTCEPGRKFLSIELEPDEGFVHLLRPVARRAYADCGWRLHISVGHAACPLSQELWGSFCADWSAWDRGHSYHFSVERMSGSCSAELSPTYILQDWRIQLLQ